MKKAPKDRKFRKRETTAEWFGKPLINPHPAYFERAIFTTDTPEYKLMSSLRARFRREKKRANDSRTLFIDPQILISFAAFVSAVGRSPSPNHRGRLIERKLGWIAGNVKWVLPNEEVHRPNFVDLIGMKFGRYTVIGPHQRLNSGTRWYCRCDCGYEGFVGTTNLKRAGIKCKSCAAKARMDNPEHLRVRRQKKSDRKNNDKALTI